MFTVLALRRGRNKDSHTSMDLPELGLQWVYARIAWGVVCASLVWICLPASATARARAIAACVAMLSMWLPGTASPAHWLGLVFQYPSVTLAVCCAVVALNRAASQGASPNAAPDSPSLSLWERAGVRAGGRGGELRRLEELSTPEPVAALEPVFGFALALCGALLYLDATGWLHLDLYARGADPIVAPVTALLLGAGAAAWIARAQRGRTAASAGLWQSTAPAWAVLAGVTVFSVARLPTGNLFDSLLDPLLWLWALATTLRIAAHGLWRH